MKYLVDGRQITETEAEEITAKNNQIWERFENSGDFAVLLDITFMFGEEVEQAEKEARKKHKS